MSPVDDFEDLGLDQDGPSDPKEADAREDLREFFESRREAVFFSRQVEIHFELKYFHWITNRAIRDLLEEGVLQSERRKLRTGGSIHLLWHRGYRYYRRTAARVVQLVEEYSDPNIGGALGLQGEALVLEGFARHEFVMKGRETRRFRDRTWDVSEHDLDFIFERDALSYGIEVKNTLGYMEHQEFLRKIEICRFLGITPVFVARMLPKAWIYELRSADGFALILRYQLYPWAHRELAQRVSREFELPVDSPRALAEGTMRRFIQWHEKRVNRENNSREP